MRTLKQCLTVMLALLSAVACSGAWAVENADGFEGWNLEPGVAQAHLVMVARVASISRVTVVEGAKTDVALREYRFQPVRVLKGIFRRDQLSMTASDLGCPPDDASSAPPLQEGEFRLLILAQQQGSNSFGGINTFGCVSAAPGATTLEQRVPLLTGPDDPLVGVVETLIQVIDSRSRRERATLLIDRLATTSGRAAVPLLTSLRLRADWAAAEGRGYAPVRVLLGDATASAVRGAAVDVLRDMLASGIKPNDLGQLDGVAEALQGVLAADEPKTTVRLAAVEALGHLLALKSNYEWPRDMLIAQLTRAATYAERNAAATALSGFADSLPVAAVRNELTELPLDELPEREAALARAAVRLDAAGAEVVLIERLERSIAARQSLEAEVVALGRMRSKASLPLLLVAARQADLTPRDRHYIAWALGQVGDDRAARVLAEWVRRDSFQVKDVALAALENLDSPAAANEVRPLLKTEAYLPYKLRLARLLARHGIADGYSLAAEHLSDMAHTASAALVLAALNDPRATDDLTAIVGAQPDRRWRGAALTGLAAIGNADARRQLLSILADDRDPLAADAAVAAGVAGDAELLRPLAKLVRSRNKQIAMASLTALRRYLSGVRTSPRGLAALDPPLPDDDDGSGSAVAADIPADTRAAIAEAVAAVAVDAYVDADLRHEALAVARLLGGERYAKLLADLADQAELEGTPLMKEVQSNRRNAALMRPPVSASRGTL